MKETSMLTPFLYMDINEIKVGDFVLAKKTKEFKKRNENLIDPDQKSIKSLLLTEYVIFKTKSSQEYGKLKLDCSTRKYENILLKYDFHSSLPHNYKVKILRCFLKNVQNFYGWCLGEEQGGIQMEEVFQEIHVHIPHQDGDVKIFLESGFKIGRVTSNQLTLKHGYSDQTSLRIEEVKPWLLDDQNHTLSIQGLHRKKLEKAIMSGQVLSRSDMETLKEYLKNDRDAWSYYLLLISENPKLYIDYANIMTTLDMLKH